MAFIKHNSLKSDIFFNPIFIPCFSGSKFFRVQVFQGQGRRILGFLKINQRYTQGKTSALLNSVKKFIEI